MLSTKKFKNSFSSVLLLHTNISVKNRYIWMVYLFFVFGYGVYIIKGDD